MSTIDNLPASRIENLPAPVSGDQTALVAMKRAVACQRMGFKAARTILKGGLGFIPVICLGLPALAISPTVAGVLVAGGLVGMCGFGIVGFVVGLMTDIYYDPYEAEKKYNQSLLPAARKALEQAVTSVTPEVGFEVPLAITDGTTKLVHVKEVEPQIIVTNGNAVRQATITAELYNMTSQDDGNLLRGGRLPSTQFKYVLRASIPNVPPPARANLPPAPAS